MSGLTTILSNAPITDRHVDTRIATNERLLLIIEALSEAGKPLTPTELNAKIGLPKQSVHRLCNTLIAEAIGRSIREAYADGEQQPGH